MSSFSKITTAVAAVVILMPVLIAAAVQGVLSSVVGASSQPSATALTDIPDEYLTLYREAATICPALDWTILAAVGKVESDHGRSSLPGVHGGENTAGAGGPMQFLNDTFDRVVARHGLPPGGASPPSRYDAHDAIYAAAFYLCDSGADHGEIRAALFSYNHADWYVTQVLTQASRYRETVPAGAVSCESFLPYRQHALGGNGVWAAVAFACAQLGKPYVWGGNGNPGFDCSGLTYAAYAAAGIDIPRTAQTQYNAGPLLPADARLQPGDLLFFGAPGHIHHVGISLGGTLMINAPDFGQAVTVSDLRNLPDYAGASRPASAVVLPQTGQ